MMFTFTWVSPLIHNKGARGNVTITREVKHD